MKQITTNRTYPGHKYKPLRIDRMVIHQPDMMGNEIAILIFHPDPYRELIDPTLTIKVYGATPHLNVRAEIAWGADLGKHPEIQDWRKRAREVIPILLKRLETALYG